MRATDASDDNLAVLIDPAWRVGNIQGAREGTTMHLDIPSGGPHFRTKVCAGGDIVRGSDLAVVNQADQAAPGRRILALGSSQTGCKA